MVIPSKPIGVIGQHLVVAASIPLGKRVKSPKKPTNVDDSGEEEEEEEVRGRRILKLNPALFDDDESD